MNLNLDHINLNFEIYNPNFECVKIWVDHVRIFAGHSDQGARNKHRTAMTYRIPTANSKFNTYIRATAAALAEGTPTTAERLGLSADQLAQWGNYRDEWAEVYAKHTNDDLRTTTHTMNKNEVRRNFMAFATPLLTAMSVHAALTTGDRNTFNLPERDRTITKRSKIHDKANAFLSPMDSGLIKVRVRVPGDSGRASRHPQCDHLEMRYQLVAPTGVDANGTLLWPDPPTTSSECPHSTISTRAIFTLELGKDHSGKRIYAFFRWVNARDLKLSGPWSGPVQCGVA